MNKAGPPFGLVLPKPRLLLEPGLGRATAIRRAFTLIELSVVVAIITILAAMILPVLAKAKSNAKTSNCLSNFKELTLAWTIYAGDNREYLANNHTDGNGTSGAEAWVSSGRDARLGVWTGNARLDTNDIAITQGSLFAYSGQPGIYHCPADRSFCIRNPTVPRNRSVSMSTGMNWRDWSEDAPTNGSFVKFTDILEPRPHMASVFLDEAANSIDNNAIGIYSGRLIDSGHGINPGQGYYRYWNVPASRHNNGCVLSFADGHAEWWKWLDPWVVAANTLPDNSLQTAIAPALDISTQPGDRDLQRLKMTVPVSPSPANPDITH